MRFLFLVKSSEADVGSSMEHPVLHRAVVLALGIVLFMFLIRGTPKDADQQAVTPPISRSKSDTPQKVPPQHNNSTPPQTKQNSLPRILYPSEAQIGKLSVGTRRTKGDGRHNTRRYTKAS